MLGSDPQLGFWCEPCMAWLGALRALPVTVGAPPAYLGWAPAKQVFVAQKLAGCSAAMWRGAGEGGAWAGG